MTDVLTTPTRTEDVDDLEARLRDVDDVLPHEFKVADAEPAVPGWRFRVDEPFD